MKIFKIFGQSSDTKDLINALESNPKINDLAENPLMLTIMSLMMLKGRNISQESRWELLKFCTDTFLDEWLVFKQLKVPDNKKILHN